MFRKLEKLKMPSQYFRWASTFSGVTEFHIMILYFSKKSTTVRKRNWKASGKDVATH